MQELRARVDGDDRPLADPAQEGERAQWSQNIAASTYGPGLSRELPLSLGPLRPLPLKRCPVCLRVAQLCAARKAPQLTGPVAIHQVAVAPRARGLVPGHRQEPPCLRFPGVLPLRPLHLRVPHSCPSLLLSRLPTHCHFLLALAGGAGRDGPCWTQPPPAWISRPPAVRWLTRTGISSPPCLKGLQHCSALPFKRCLSHMGSAAPTRPRAPTATCGWDVRLGPALRYPSSAPFVAWGAFEDSGVGLAG
jgi:hypothetical protein